MDLTIVLILSLICLILGFLASSLISALRSDRATPVGKKTSPPDADLVEVAHLWRDRRKGTLVLKRGGQVFRSASELSATQRNELGRAARELHAWLRVSSPESQPPETPPVEDVARPVGVQAYGTASPQEQEVRQPGASPLGVLSRALGPDMSKVAPAFKSLAAQIDEVLQEMLASTHLAGRGIRLMESPTQGVIVAVGLEKYEGIDAVPDEEIRELIREAVREWEQRSARGA